MRKTFIVAALVAGALLAGCDDGYPDEVDGSPVTCIEGDYQLYQAEVYTRKGKPKHVELDCEAALRALVVEDDE